MRRLAFTLLVAVALVAATEALFEAGIWEPLARPDSHAGTSVRLKRALASPAAARLDFVTIGSSRPEFGLDHAAIAAAAKARGFVHADLSMPGTHWMTVGILTDWLARHHPEIRGGVIALAVQDFAYPGNGDYELGIVAPFRRLSDIPWITEHVPFRREDIETYGDYSALFGWRQDIRDFVAAPRQRIRALTWYARQPAASMLFDNPESSGDMCHVGFDSLAACDRVAASADPKLAGLKHQCVEIRAATSGSLDYGALMRQVPMPETMRKTRDLVRDQLLRTPWPLPPVVVLMPMPRIWFDGGHANGIRAWALSVLQPLADAGRIRLIDATGFFDGDPDHGCSAFFDFYHENAAGRTSLTRWLLPQLEHDLYDVESSRRAIAGPQPR